MKYGIVVSKILSDLEECNFFNEFRSEDNYNFDFGNGYGVFIYIDDSLDEETITIEPNNINDGCYEPLENCGTTSVNKLSFVMELLYVIDDIYERKGK